ncbi:MAG: arginine--tRNA ligase, partial [Bacteroidetes bacterium]
MSDLVSLLKTEVSQAVKELYDLDYPPEEVPVNPTRKEFEGDWTVVVFPFTKGARKAPEQLARELGTALQERLPHLQSFNVIKGFLNLRMSEDFWKSFLLERALGEGFGRFPATGQKIMVEFSSPNTNKPLHLGHIRNILLGWSISRILEATGNEVIKVQIVNDRGIAICRSMLAWQKFGQGETPESSGMKGDHLVGKYYVEFARRFDEEYEQWQKTPEAEAVFQARRQPDEAPEAFFKRFKNDYFNEYSKLGAEAREMLRKWEAGDPEVRMLWRMMNDWVLEGFEQTYQKLGVHFDKLYFESDTYLLGKEIIEEGIAKGVLHRDGKRAWIDLENIGLGQKTIIKSDGTSTYTSQDLGTARLRYQDFGFHRLIYVVGDEQISHFQSLFEILKRLGEPYAEGLYHLAYGMVDLPFGRMKSREGTVVDADDLIEEVIAEARKNAQERGELAGLSPEEQEAIIRKIGLAALKFFIIKVQPRRRMIFNPEESVDLQGQTGPYIQNAYVRIRSVLRKAGEQDLGPAKSYAPLQEQEKLLVQLLFQYPETLQAAAQEYDPSHLANYCYNLAKAYHKFYHDHPILQAESEPARAFRLA